MNYEYLQNLFYSLFPLCKEESDLDNEEDLPYAIPLDSEMAILIDNNYCETVTI